MSETKEISNKKFHAMCDHYGVYGVLKRAMANGLEPTDEQLAYEIEKEAKTNEKVNTELKKAGWPVWDFPFYDWM